MSDEINQSVVTSQTTSLDHTSEVVSKINKSSEIKKINLDDETESNFEVVNKEQRKNLKLYIAGFLAVSLWITLIITIAFHFYNINQLSQKLASVTGDEIVNQATYIKEAIAANNDTAKTLYSFLTPLAAGVTGYFFEVARQED